MLFVYIPLKLVLGILQIQGNLLHSLNKLEKTEGTIKNGLSRYTGNIGHKTGYEDDQNRSTTQTTKTMIN